MPVHLLDHIQGQGEQGHSHQHAIVGLAEDRQIRIVVQVVVQLPRIIVLGSQWWV